jgi:tRNA-Thr(GGU) m(6)t(6)A37 methyltransferase TsaA
MSDEQLEIIIKPIGIIRSQNTSAAGTPIQPAYAEQLEGEVVIYERFTAALADIEGFERIWIIYGFDRSGPFKHRVVPYRDTREHGLFATRAPSRPNPIGMSVVRLLGREDNVLLVRGIDVLDGTPLIDIKPYVPEFDAYSDSKAGWFDERREDRREADERFHEPRTR